jgi:ferredoxin
MEESEGRGRTGREPRGNPGTGPEFPEGFFKPNGPGSERLPGGNLFRTLGMSVDFGITGSKHPKVTGEPRNQCRACIDSCKEEAVCFEGAQKKPIIDYGKCLSCG